MPRHCTRSLSSGLADVLTHSLDRRRVAAGMMGAALGGAALAHGGTARAARRPKASAGSPREALESLLALVPASVATQAVPGGYLFYHADLQAQFAALGIGRSEPGWQDSVHLATLSLALVSPLFRFRRVDVVETTLGFVPMEADRALETGMPPESLSLFQGAFDRERMEAAWEATGYQQVPLDEGGVLWTVGEEGEFDAKHPLAAVSPGAFNNLILLDDETLAISRKGVTARAMAQQMAAGGSSMLDMPHVGEAIRSLLPETASSMLVSGEVLVPRGVPDLTATGDEPEMPAAAMAIFGVEAGFEGVPVDTSSETTVLPGDTPVAEVKRTQARLTMRSAEDAAVAVEVAAERWETLDSLVNGEPYNDLMLLLDAEVSADEPTVAAFDFDQGSAGNRWVNLVSAQDLLPFAPGAM
ncbi:MAG: hypothetical protein QM753_02185 [Thermomicrobiales bacterium]